MHVFVLLLEAAWRVASLMRTDTHVVKLSLLGRHVAAITIESANSCLGAAIDTA